MRYLVSDAGPNGSSPVWDPWIIATMACLIQGLTVEEALLGLTRRAGQALGYPEAGLLREGLQGDLVLVQPPPGEPLAPASLIQPLGGVRVPLVVQAGRCVAQEI